MKKAARHILPLYFKGTVIFIFQTITKIWMIFHQYTQTDTNLSDTIHTWRDYYFLKALISKTRIFPWYRTPWSQTNSLAGNRDLHSAESHRDSKVWRIPATARQSFRIRDYVKSKIARVLSCTREKTNSCY